MRIQQGPYIGEVDRHGNFVIACEGATVEAGVAPTVKEAFDLMETLIDQRCKEDRASGKLYLVS